MKGKSDMEELEDERKVRHREGRARRWDKGEREERARYWEESETERRMKDNQMTLQKQKEY